jgi:glycosyltransferase involved in cell wall biosynthesis
LTVSIAFDTTSLHFPTLKQAVPEPQTITPPALHAERVFVDGKFFRVGAQKFYVKGCTYGPFAPHGGSDTLPVYRTAVRDMALLRELGANTIRVYEVPPPWFLDLAAQHGLKLFVDFAWPKHTCFLDDPKVARTARETARQAAQTLAGHPAVFALNVVNEIPPDIARWYGAKRVEKFIDELTLIVKETDPERLVTFVNFPTTEFLQPTSVDFYSYNVYLHNRQPFANYLDRLQGLAADKPLLIAEFGIDSQREGEERKCEILRGHIETAFRAGTAGTILFSFTDDWHTGGHQIDNWFFGLTTRERTPKPSFRVVAEQFRKAPYFPLPRYPRVSVVVASHNGARTLPACLDSLTHLNYPDHEVILVDDGSSDDTLKIAHHYPGVRTIHQKNLGLSAARNTGIAAAAGEIIAFTDSDCRADEDWLYYLVGDLLKTDAAAIGGHNFPPPHDDSVTAACVAVAPGAPAHVMLDDRNAEHVPGCNMAFWRWALDEIGGFDPQFRAAGDDVDVCWRLLQANQRIAFSHSGFVWHYRRNSVMAYLKQQYGYGVAEALLRRKHPEYFNAIGAMRWRGRIYSPSKMRGFFGRAVIYHGIFGTALFQTLYAPTPGGAVVLLTSIEWHALVTLPSVMLALMAPALWPLPMIFAGATLGMCAWAGARAELPARYRMWWMRPLVAFLYFAQPLARAWPRYRDRLRREGTPAAVLEKLRPRAQSYRKAHSALRLQFWNEQGVGRLEFLEKLQETLDADRWQSRADSGWDDFDVMIYGDRFSRVPLKTVCENHGGNKRLLRVRLRAEWTLFAKVVFGIATVFSLLTFDVLGRSWWTAPILLLIPLVATYIHLRAQRLLRLTAALADTVAESLGMKRISASNPAKPH